MVNGGKEWKGAFSSIRNTKYPIFDEEVCFLYSGIYSHFQNQWHYKGHARSASSVGQKGHDELLITLNCYQKQNFANSAFACVSFPLSQILHLRIIGIGHSLQCSQMTFSKIRTNAVWKIRTDWKNSELFPDMGINLKDFVSTIEIRHTFLNLTILNYFININHIFKRNIAYLILRLWYN